MGQPAQRTEMLRTEIGKLDQLESIRGLLALTVVFSHLVAAFYPVVKLSSGPFWYSGSWRFSARTRDAGSFWLPWRFCAWR